MALTPVGRESFAVLDAVKTAFDGSGDLILRLHEAAGARSRIRLDLDGDVQEVREVDLLEVGVDDPTQKLPATASTLELTLRPFQILTLRVRRAS